jgi:CBS domain containing-hemolysin-like protein
MAEYWSGLVWLAVLLVVNAFFVGAEFAVVSARRSQIEPKADQGSRAAQTTLWAMEHATLMLATSQLGITVCSLLILNVSEPAIHHLLEYPLGRTALSEDAIGIIAFVVALVLVTFLHVVLGEMVPKNLSFSLPERAALLLAPPLVLISRIFKPIIHGLNWLANVVVRRSGVEPKDEATSAYTLDEVASIVEQSTREGVLTDTSGTLTAAFDFTAKKVFDVAVPTRQIVTLSAGSTPAQVHRAVADHGYSRYILTDDTGDPAGYLHLKDILDLAAPPMAEQPVPAELVRPLPAVRDDADLEDALAVMRRGDNHVARAVGADGQVTGVVFLEDILEELIGEVTDAAAG